MSTETPIDVRVAQVLTVLGADVAMLKQRRLPYFHEATELTVAHISDSGREHRLVPGAAARWREMRQAAMADGVTILVVSGFRSFIKQQELVESRLATGEPIDSILRVLAPPGCSEHHTGRAVDIGTPGCPPLSETFEDTTAFAWLTKQASQFGFKLSYPRDNPHGYLYEPWHWCHSGD